MSEMYQVGNHFVRIKEEGARLELSVWNNLGKKLISEFVSAGTLSDTWDKIAKYTSQEVVDSVRTRINAN